jgi:hypothetical protein
MSEEYGYVYCIANESMPGIVKIGMTSRTPPDRLSEANGSDTWRPPTPFVIKFAKKVRNALQKEKTIHRILEQYNERINLDREFFRISEEKAKLYFELMDGEWWEHPVGEMTIANIKTKSGRRNKIIPNVNVAVIKEDPEEPNNSATIETKEERKAKKAKKTEQDERMKQETKQQEDKRSHSILTDSERTICQKDIIELNIYNISINEKQTLMQFCINNCRLNIKVNSKYYSSTEFKSIMKRDIMYKRFIAIITSHLVEDRVIKSNNFAQILKELQEGTPNVCVILEETC